MTFYRYKNFIILTMTLLFNLTMISTSYGVTFENKVNAIIEISYNTFLVCDEKIDFEEHRVVLSPDEKFNVDIIRKSRGSKARIPLYDHKLTERSYKRSKALYGQRQHNIYSHASILQEQLKKINPSTRLLLSRIPVITDVKILQAPSVQNLEYSKTNRNAKLHSKLTKNLSDVSRGYIKTTQNTLFFLLKSKIQGNKWMQNKITIEKIGDDEASVYEIQQKPNGKIILK